MVFMACILIRILHLELCTRQSSIKPLQDLAWWHLHHIHILLSQVSKANTYHRPTGFLFQQ
jgi:hypothetical protein